MIILSTIFILATTIAFTGAALKPKIEAWLEE
jgi:hypothetical protein